MAAHWQRFTLALLDRITRALRVDVLMVSEDMAYKAHSMISPAMARRFLQPTYLAWHELLSARGCRVFDMDSDGDISELAPLWLESGFNCLNPIEIAAGNDPLSLRARYGRRLALRGGLDKRCWPWAARPCRPCCGPSCRRSWPRGVTSPRATMACRQTSPGPTTSPARASWPACLAGADGWWAHRAMLQSQRQRPARRWPLAGMAAAGERIVEPTASIQHVANAHRQHGRPWAQGQGARGHGFGSLARPGC